MNNVNHQIDCGDEGAGRRLEELPAGLWLDLRSLADLDRATVELVGGKAANLARLAALGMPVPCAVVLTAAGWRLFRDQTGIGRQLDEIIAGLGSSPYDVDEPAGRIAALIDAAPMPAELAGQMTAVFTGLSRPGEMRLAIRSSGSYEDSPAASFSGMLSTVLGVDSVEAALAAVKRCWTSGYSPRSLRYLARMGLDAGGMALAVIFQQMVAASSSGVLFTVDPATGDKSVAVLEAAYGYGPGVVSGNVTPDLYRVRKEGLEIVHRDARPQEFYYVADGSRREVALKRRRQAKLTDEEVRQLVAWGIEAEESLGAPQDIEWCRDAAGRLVLLQTRPVTGLERLSLRQKKFSRPEVVMVRGIGVSPRTGWGEVVKLDPEAGGALPELKGRVVVVPRLTQDLASHMKEAAAVVADGGGSTSHGANILREFQVPCVVGVRYGTDVLSDGDVVTVDGWRGLVLDGIGPRIRERQFGPEQPLATRTKLMTTINVPESAEKAAEIADGVISLRNDYLLLQGGVHPGRLLKSGGGEALTASIHEALTLVARAFEGKPVWYKTLDAPTDEFRRLRGGEDEPLERNPLLGWRGIGRELEDLLLLRAEYEAVRRAVADGCDNLGIKVPFIRHISEYERAREVAVAVGLKPHEDVKFGASVETPAAALTVDTLIDAQVDFFSVGVNDLTMCCLGVDRESERVADRFDPAHPAVLSLLASIAAGARGQLFLAAAGDLAQSPELIAELIRLGYDALGISLPYLGTVRSQVAELEETR